MASGGWIKLFRKIIDWEWYRDGNTFRVFVHLLVTANHEPKKWRGVIVNRGQVVTGRKALAKSLSLSDQEIRTALKHLKSTSEITIEATNKYSLITLVNYEEYQGNEEESNQQNNQHANIQSTSNQPASNQQVTTNKNVRTKECKKDKEVKNVYGEFSRVKLTDDQYEKLVNKYGQVIVDQYIKKIDCYVESGGKSYKSFYAAIIKWVDGDIEKGKLGKRQNSGNQFADWVREQEAL